MTSWNPIVRTLIVTPPTDGWSSLRWTPANVVLASLDVGEVTSTESTGEDCADNHRVGGRILQPNGLVLNVINDLAARDVSATSDLACAEYEWPRINNLELQKEASEWEGPGKWVAKCKKSPSRCISFQPHLLLQSLIPSWSLIIIFEGVFMTYRGRARRAAKRAFIFFLRFVLSKRIDILHDCWLLIHQKFREGAAEVAGFYSMKNRSSQLLRWNANLANSLWSEWCMYNYVTHKEEKPELRHIMYVKPGMRFWVANQFDWSIFFD